MQELNPYKDFRRFKTKHEELLSILEQTIIVPPVALQVNLKVLDTGDVKLTISPSTKIPIVSHLLERLLAEIYTKALH